MAPDPPPGPLQCAQALEVDAQIEHDKHNHVFAQELARRAHHLRMQHQQDQTAKDKLQ